MRNIIVILSIGFGLTFLSCREKPNPKIIEIVSEWQGKEIVFPENIVFTRYGKDTLSYQIPESDYKIVMYTDSIGCMKCKMQLYKWREFIKEVDDLTEGSVPFLFIFHPADPREISFLLMRDEVDIPVFIDLDDRTNKINNFPSNSAFQSFLLDRDNNVVYIGDPTNNHRIKAMYLNRLSEGAYSAASTTKKTSVEIDQTEFDLGTIRQGKPVTITTTIRNTGDAPFIIFNTRSSCGCTDVLYDRKPVLPDSLTEISITYDADDSGYFHKTVSIHGNAEESPFILKIKGNVE
ncbi:DUF1573 domain-containing protein [Proteiniphilum sp.]|uniref:DUF1573 domain-containing protein n=1 Tax=Proteiniphilum sp. TaxID=1926877 RepID=UPI002B201CBE|nr:DUF1573 domain-containing protein [Proteiniphilum sp.]MEA4919283.1 DUF1573 domain-containing protein [Proteiniphilum sp.]